MTLSGQGSASGSSSSIISSSTAKPALRSNTQLNDPKSIDEAEVHLEVTNYLSHDMPRTKGNLALRLIESENGEGDLAGVKVVVARKLGNGGVIMEFNSAEAAPIVRAIKDAFAAKLGGTSILRDREYSAMAEFVPVSHDPDSEEERRAIEVDSGLVTRCIASTKWIKPMSRRHDTQTLAHLLIRFSSAEAANAAIRDGPVLGSRRVSAHRPETDPQRCMKCQMFGAKHRAAECPHPDTCATCGHGHQTSECTNQSELRCTNCRADGHASWSRECPEFLKRKRAMKAKSDSRFYETDEPWTWAETPLPPPAAPAAPLPSRGRTARPEDFGYWEGEFPLHPRYAGSQRERYGAYGLATGANAARPADGQFSR